MSNTTKGLNQWILRSTERIFFVQLVCCSAEIKYLQVLIFSCIARNGAHYLCVLSRVQVHINLYIFFFIKSGSQRPCQASKYWLWEHLDPNIITDQISPNMYPLMQPTHQLKLIWIAYDQGYDHLAIPTNDGSLLASKIIAIK